MLRKATYAQGERAKKVEWTLPDINNCYKDIVQKMLWYNLTDFYSQNRIEKTESERTNMKLDV